MPRYVSLLAVILLSALAPVLGASSTVTVCSSGCGYKTISAAIANSATGYVLQLLDPTYRENTTISLAVSLTLQSNGVVRVDGPGTWLSIPNGGELITEGSFVLNTAGIELASGSTWTQNGPLSILSESGLVIVGVRSLGGTWNQNGDVTIASDGITGGIAQGVDLSGGATWNQNGTMTVSLRSTTALTGILLKEAVWNQNRSLTVNAIAQFVQGVSAETGSTWNQNAQATIFAQGGTLGVTAGVLLQANEWRQNGPMSITALGYQTFGVRTMQAARWHQIGSLQVTYNATLSALGVYLTGQWDQFGDVFINEISTKQIASNAVAIASGATWNQYGIYNVTSELNSQANVYGVSLWGTWNQYNDVKMKIKQSTGLATGVDVPTNGTWNHNSGVTKIDATGSYGRGVGIPGGTVIQRGVWDISFTSLASTSTYGVLSTGLWRQEETATIRVDGTNVEGIHLDGAAWHQLSPISINASGTGISFFSTGRWYQNASAEITINADGACGIDLSYGSESWIRNAALPSMVINGRNTYPVCTIIPDPSLDQLGVTFNFNRPSLLIGAPPRDGDVVADRSKSVQFQLATLEEITPDGSVVQTAALLDYGWQAINATDGTVSGEAKTLIFKTTLPDTNAEVVYTFMTFANQTSIPIGGNETLSVTPQYVKLSLSLSSWHWIAPENRLQFSIKVDPAFNTSSVRSSTPKKDVTSICTRSIDPSHAGALVRLLNFGLTVPAGDRVGCSIATNDAMSAITMTFDYFGNSSLFYDPDLSLIVGGSDSKGSSDNLGVVVGVSVAVPLAVIAVVAIIVGASVAIWIRKRRARGESMINFSADEEENEL